jgi:arylsulfatase A-like enzyme
MGMASSGPNVLFILADDLGYADVSCFGRRDFATPNIDRIAAEGVRFTQVEGCTMTLRLVPRRRCRAR